ncbi:MAG: sigma-70 family RNA polymerase sigma factor [Candidatus Krumholzibacteriia bacterium]
MELQRALRDRRHARWVQAARDGDERALVRLYDELHPPVASYLRLRVRVSHDAEDLVSTVFHRFLSNLERYDPRRGSVLGWVLVMARHALIDHLRRTRPTVPVDDVAEVLAGDFPDPLEGLIRTEQADRVRAVVAQLPAEARELLALHYGQGLRLRDIGGLLGLSEAAVKQRLSRLRRELRVRLRNETDPAPRPAAPVRAVARAAAGGERAG